MRTGALVVTGAGLVALSVADVAYRLRDWGAAAREVSAVLPGDELVHGSAERNTVGVGAAAPAAACWEALCGVLAAEARADELQPGLDVPLVPLPGLGRSRLVRLEPGRDVVLAQGGRGVVVSFHVLQTATDRCRLVARTRVPYTGAGWFAARAVDPAAILLARRLLRRTAVRAEGAARAEEAAQRVTTLDRPWIASG
jgi:hypothetical protein